MNRLTLITKAEFVRDTLGKDMHYAGSVWVQPKQVKDAITGALRAIDPCDLALDRMRKLENKGPNLRFAVPDGHKSYLNIAGCTTKIYKHTLSDGNKRFFVITTWTAWPPKKLINIVAYILPGSVEDECK